MTTKQHDFRQFNLEESILNTLVALGWEKPTTVQEEVIPKVQAGHDLRVKSQTGSGKTAAFAIPLCNALEWEENKPQVLVLAPTRELALQVKEEFFHIGRYKRIKAVGLYGKAPFHIQQKELKQKTHVVVGTPGRVLDHLERGTLVTSAIRYIVIDEADEMFKMGFMETIEQILERMPSEHQTLLFSATFNKAVEKLSASYMKEPVSVTIESTQLTAERIEQVAYKVEGENKLKALYETLVSVNPQCCMIFANTKNQVDEIEQYLMEKEMRILKVHGGMEQRDRFAAMEDFRRGKVRYMVATDVAARGIDIDHITEVINFDLPEDKENYVHRIGRTGRNGREGRAISLIQESERAYLKALSGYIGFEIPIREGAQLGQDSSEAFEERKMTSVVLEETKEEQLAKDIMKLHINAGKKTKMRPVDIVGTLSNLQGMSAADIGIINVQDVSTFVEVLNGKGSAVLKQLQTTPIKGRLRKVSQTDRR